MTTRLDRIELAAQRTLLDVSGYHVIEDIRALIVVARAAKRLYERREIQSHGMCMFSMLDVGDLERSLAPLLEEVK